MTQKAELEQLAEIHDGFEMRRGIERLPDHIEIALNEEMPELPRGQFDRVVLFGLGGSALPADVVNDLFADRLEAPVEVWRNYGLPRAIDDSTLIIVSSFSGTTEEVLTALDRIQKEHPTVCRNVVVITSGGQLADLAEGRHPLIRIPIHKEPRGFQPRSAIGYMVTYLARILHSAGLMSEPTESLEAVKRFLALVDVQPAAWDAARWLGARIPMVYTDEIHQLSVARVAKIKFNENSKRPAFFNSFPELNHNEMIGFKSPLGEFAVLFLDDPESHPMVRRRFEAMKRVFERDGLNHVGFRRWEMPGDSNVARVFAALMFADWCSYSVGLMAGLDPTPVGLVEDFKARLDSEGEDR